MSAPFLILIGYLFLVLQRFENQAFQFFGQFRIVYDHLLGSITSLTQLGFVVAEL